MRTLNWIQSNLVIAIPATMLSGFLYGLLFSADFLKVLIIPLTFLMVYPVMVTLPLNKIVSGKDAKVQLIAQFINFAIIPFVAYGIGKFFFPNKPEYVVGLLLAGLLPTSGMTISWTNMAKGNTAAAVKMTMAGLLVGSVLAPFYLRLLMGAEVSIPLMKIFYQIIIVVLLPLLVGNLTQRIIIAKQGMERYESHTKKMFAPISMLGVIGIVFIAIALKASTIAENPEEILFILIPLIILYGINFSLSSIVGKKFFSSKDGIALVYGTVLRNLSIALAIAMSAFGSAGSSIAIVIALAYIVQVQLAAWYQKYAVRLFYGTK